MLVSLNTALRRAVVCAHVTPLMRLSSTISAPVVGMGILTVGSLSGLLLLPTIAHDAKQQEAKSSRSTSFSLSSSSFRCSATSAAALPREFLISLGLVAMAGLSIANESATGVLVLAR